MLLPLLLALATPPSGASDARPIGAATTISFAGNGGLIPLDTLAYATNNLGQFDLFSRISFLRQPNVACGVRSIRTSLPPAGHQGRRARR